MLYKQINKIPESYIKQKIKEFLIEDIPKKDITSEFLIKNKKEATAEIQAGEKLIFVGRNIIKYYFTKGCIVNIEKKDGESVLKNEKIGTIKGPAHSLLERERSMLNMIQKLSVIASYTKKLSKIADQHKVKILDTRKTTPGLRYFEKYAVRCGGGRNHRLNLSSGILIKDNHLAITKNIEEIVKKIRLSQPNIPIEIEIESINQIEKAINANVDAILLDNMSPKEVKKAAKKIKAKEKKIFIECSGGINENNFRKYLTTGIDAISIGAITHSAPTADIRLEIKT